MSSEDVTESMPDQPPATGSVVATTAQWAVEPDLDEQQPLLGVPWGALWSVHMVRGGLLLAIAVAILLWPQRTDRVLAFLLGVALVLYAGASLVEVVRHRGARTFRTMLSIGVAAGTGLGLVRDPSGALVTAAGLVGIVVLGLAVLDLLRMGWRRRWSSGVVTRAVVMGIGGGLLWFYPDTMVVVVVSIGALLLAAAGLIEILVPVDEHASQADPGSDARSRPALGVSLLVWIRHRPDLAEERTVLMDKLYFEGGSAPTRYARFLALMGFASVIASVGVVVESTAVVIGAMLIAPLMVPLMGTALAVPMGWPRRLQRSAGIALSGVVLAISVGALVGAIVPRTVDVSSNAEILARITPTVVDLFIAVAAGAAGAYALARRDVSDSLPGVAVAIALVPPLTVVGLCWQQAAWAEGNGALLLFTTNAIAILVAGGGMFVLVGAAPMERLSGTQDRVRTVLTGLAAMAVAVVVLLGLNGRELAAAELRRAGIDEALATWSEDRPDYRVLDVRTLPDGSLIIDLAGPGEPPGLDQLLGSLREPVGEDTSISVTWIPQERVVIQGE